MSKTSSRSYAHSAGKGIYAHQGESLVRFIGVNIELRRLYHGQDMRIGSKEALKRNKKKQFLIFSSMGTYLVHTIIRTFVV